MAFAGLFVGQALHRYVGPQLLPQRKLKRRKTLNAQPEGPLGCLSPPEKSYGQAALPFLFVTPPSSSTSPAPDDMINHETARLYSTIDRSAQLDFAEKIVLERLSWAMFDIINKCDWDYSSHDAAEALRRVSPRYKTLTVEYPQPLTFEEFTRFLRELAEHDPSFHVKLLRKETDFDSVGGSAIVYLSMDFTGLEGLEKIAGNEGPARTETRALVTGIEWERDETGFWWCLGCIGMKRPTNDDELM